MERDCYLWKEWEDQTLWTVFLKSRSRFSEQIFALNESKSYTYDGIFERAVTVARSMMALGIRPGDHVAFLLTNSPDYIANMLAAASLGAVSVLGNPNLGRMELQHVIKQSDASWVISDRILDDEMLRQCPMVKRVIVTKENRLYQSENLMYFSEFTALSEQVSYEEWKAVSEQNQKPEALAVIMYTSGSTAMPKGVTMTHDDLVRSVYSACLRRRIPVGHRAYVPVPFFHVFGYVEGLLCMMFAGGILILSELKFNTSQALHLMRYHQANEIICITNMMERILRKENPNPEEFSHLRKAFISPSHPQWVWEKCKEAFGISYIITGYGMTETLSAITYADNKELENANQLHHGRIKPAGCSVKAGADPKWIQIRICDPDTGRELPEGEVGEICCKGPALSHGYYKNPEADAAAFDTEGWFHTGDLGQYKDETLTFISRKTEIYKVNGEKVSPQFVIHCMLQCELIRAVEVVGIPHPHSGEAGVAFIDAVDETEETKARIEQYCEANLARFQIPKYMIYGDSSKWPKTASQKINRKELVKLAQTILDV